MIGEGDCGEIGGMKIGRGNRSTRRKPAPAPLCPRQISHEIFKIRILCVFLDFPVRVILLHLYLHVYFVMTKFPVPSPVLRPSKKFRPSPRPYINRLKYRYRLPWNVLIVLRVLISLSFSHVPLFKLIFHWYSGSTRHCGD
jgi:hypothetical protein